MGKNQKKSVAKEEEQSKSLHSFFSSPFFESQISNTRTVQEKAAAPRNVRSLFRASFFQPAFKVACSTKADRFNLSRTWSKSSCKLTLNHEAKNGLKSAVSELNFSTFRQQLLTLSLKLLLLLPATPSKRCLPNSFFFCF